jgi:hypothetical protein
MFQHKHLFKFKITTKPLHIREQTTLGQSRQILKSNTYILSPILPFRVITKLLHFKEKTLSFHAEEIQISNEVKINLMQLMTNFHLNQIPSSKLYLYHFSSTSTKARTIQTRQDGHIFHN